MGGFKAAHGGELVNLYLDAEQSAQEKLAAGNYANWTLTTRQICDLEMLLSGAFSPLVSFNSKADYDAVVETMRLENGTLWPMPITLDISEALADELSCGDGLALRDREGVLIATLIINEKWSPDKQREAQNVFGSTDIAHPGVAYLFDHTNNIYVSGELRGIAPPDHYDFRHLRHTPAELRDYFVKVGWRKVVAFQTRNPMHRAHIELTRLASAQAEANLLIHPVVGQTKPGDVDHFTRVRCYEHAMKRSPEQTTMLSLLPLAMRMGGPREAVWHAIIRKNYGCTHFIVGRDHAGPGKDSNGEDFYGPYEAQELVTQFQGELDIAMVPFQHMVYVPERAQYMPDEEVKAPDTKLNISGTEFRRRLREGLEVEEWFSYPEVITELRKTFPPRDKQGFTVFFTGLSGSGKSTVANALLLKLMELGGRNTTLLDGDVVRTHLSSELGFSKEHRNLNIERIGYVASEITKHGGIAICAPIAPYASTRRKVREMVEAGGGFIEVHVSTPLEVCEQRDRKGLYAQARAGKIKQFTGIDDPYEIPENAEVTIDTSELSADLGAHRVLVKLESMGFIK